MLPAHKQISSDKMLSRQFLVEVRAPKGKYRIKNNNLRRYHGKPGILIEPESVHERRKTERAFEEVARFAESIGVLGIIKIRNAGVLRMELNDSQKRALEEFPYVESIHPDQHMRGKITLHSAM